MTWMDVRYTEAELGPMLVAVRNAEWGDRHRSYAGGDDRFAVWLALADLILQKRVGVSLFDLADAPLRDYYDDGLSPASAGRLVLLNDGYGGGV